MNGSYEKELAELKNLLLNVSDTYPDFAECYDDVPEENYIDVINFIKENPTAKSSDIIEYISDNFLDLDDGDYYTEEDYIKAGIKYVVVEE